MYTEGVGGLDEGFVTRTHTASCFSSVMYTEGATAAGRSEVDGFAEGGGQVCFSEGLRHRLEEEEEEEEEEERGRDERMKQHKSFQFSGF